MAAYLWATWGNMVVIEAGGANGTTGGAETVGLAIGKGAGAIVSIVMAWVFLTVAVVYNYSFGRLLFVVGHGEAPAPPVRQVNRTKCRPARSPCRPLISTILTIFVFFIVGSGDAALHKAFYVLYAGVTIVWCILDRAALPGHLLRQAERNRSVLRAGTPGSRWDGSTSAAARAGSWSTSWP